MGKVTFVVDFPDGNEPAVHARMSVLGGELSQVSWRDVMTSDEVLLESASDLLDVIDSYPKQLVPINRRSASVRLLRNAILKAKGGS